MCRYTYAEHVANVSSIKQALDGAMFNIDEISLALQLFYFQAQEGLVHKKVYSERYSVIVNLLCPTNDPSQIDHTALVDTVIRVFEEYGSTKFRAFKVTAKGPPPPGYKDCPELCIYQNDTWCLPLRNKSTKALLTDDVPADDDDSQAGMDFPVPAARVRHLLKLVLKTETQARKTEYQTSAKALKIEARFDELDEDIEVYSDN